MKFCQKIKFSKVAQQTNHFSIRNCVIIHYSEKQNNGNKDGRVETKSALRCEWEEL